MISEKNSNHIESSGTSKFPLALIFKLILTAILLTAVYSQLDLDTLKSHIMYLDLSSVFFILFLYALAQLVNTFKWRIFLLEAGIKIPQVKIIKAFFLGMSVNIFGLGTVGGDFTRAMSIPCEKGQRGSCFATVLADRIHGLITLLLIGTFSIALLRPVDVPDFILFGLFMFTGLLFFLWFIGPATILYILPDDSSIKSKLSKAFKAFPKKKLTLMYATMISFVFHSIQIYIAYVIFYSIGKSISLELAFCTIPFINAASSLPFTVNGLGVRELVAVFLLEPAGVLSESTVVYAAIWIVTITIVGATGGLFIILSSKKKFSSLFFFKNKNPDINKQHI